jgi:hypothetical protein
MRLAGLIADDAWCGHRPTKGLDGARQEEDGDIVGVNVSVVALTGLQHRNMGGEFWEIGRGNPEEMLTPSGFLFTENQVVVKQLRA